MPGEVPAAPIAAGTVDDVVVGLAAHDYLADEGLATAVLLALRLQRPLFLEGDAGVGKTEVAKSLSAWTAGRLVRLQCYEGIDASQALYEWDHARQLLHLRAAEAAGRASATGVEALEDELYAERFLVRRPLLQALDGVAGGDAPPVLLIDEIDRADDEFEAFLLELLSDWAVTIPELGTVRADVPPVTVLTSNRTRDVHDALKRRCLSHWVEQPDVEREVAIVRLRAPEDPATLAREVPLAVADRGAPRVVVDFVSRLRREGVAVPPGATVEYGRALGALGSGRPRALYWAGRATLVRRPEDIPSYDRAFAAFFGAAMPSTAAGDDDRPPGDVRTVRWSAIEVLRRKDLAECTPDELDEAHRLMADLRVHAALRRSRRRRPTRRRRGRPDLRRTVSRALRTGGEVVRPAASERGERPRRLALLLAVSGAMGPHAPGLARLADWAGGTRLGDGLRAFNDRWGVRGAARGAVVVVLSDGWDRGDPAVLGTELARLQRVAHRLVWVNPLKASPGYPPLAQGMAAALPHLDEFVEGHSIASLASLAAVVGRGAR